MSINLPLALAMIVSGTMVGGAIVLAITTAYAQTPSDPWQRFKLEAPVGNVEMRPMPPDYWEPLPVNSTWEPKGNAQAGWIHPSVADISVTAIAAARAIRAAVLKREQGSSPPR